MDEILSVTIQMEATCTEQDFSVEMFIILYKVVLSFEVVDEILKCDIEIRLLSRVLSCVPVCFFDFITL